ncbi:sugar ABC transporter ATP-binding protein [Bosea sp. Tri-44]|uniref:sugar ABC transporter ATP-binding protein n=1 Tax=Bosea sp. Tri-44 TaxID=1972137 RepID=UPI00100FA825|nr:sugar ABC transporter ATP-binding protein [Bosea sp. Tri-44]RXT56095.1 sugar ABC transporter ATP-binding protein [Bosea sp. Tri-44]
MSASAPVLSMRRIGKSFTGVRALDDVSLDCHACEVHAICGENGAGKSTLMKVLGGVYRPDEGDILLGGQPVAFRHPVEARRAGISIIHQELSLLPERSVADNIFLGLEPTRSGLLDRAAMQQGARKLLERVGARVHPDALVKSLSIAEQQLVEIAKALALDARIIVMDEPTAALDERDAGRLLELVGTLRREGAAILYISHRMAELKAIADRITVLKDGKLVATRPAEELTPTAIVRLMVGRDLADFFPAPGDPAKVGPNILSVQGAGNAILSDIALDLRAGEIVGVAGLEGSGKGALGRALFGDEPFTRGRMVVEGRDGLIGSPRAAIAAGIGFLSDDRKKEGIAPQQSLRDNVLMTLRAFAQRLLPPGSGGMARAAADRQLAEVDVRAADFAQEIRELSGGNQQKVVIGRWLARDPKVLIFLEPTRGIDVAAKAAIYQLMRGLADRGRAILMISSDLPEIIGVSDRILVMHEGSIAGELKRGASEEDVMHLALGTDATEAAA